MNNSYYCSQMKMSGLSHKLTHKINCRGDARLSNGQVDEFASQPPKDCRVGKEFLVISPMLDNDF